MKNKVIYSKISPSHHKYSSKDCDSAKLSQSQASNAMNPSGKSEENLQKIRQMEDELKILREENEFLKSNNIQYCKQINVVFPCFFEKIEV